MRGIAIAIWVRRVRRWRRAEVAVERVIKVFDPAPDMGSSQLDSAPW